MAQYVYQSEDHNLAGLDAVLETRCGDRTVPHEDEYLNMVRLLLQLRRTGSFLDVGSGPGRVTEFAKNLINRTVALEPDHKRWEVCYRNHHNPPRVSVLNQTTTDYLAENPRDKFDVILVSHVIQHQSNRVCAQILREVAALLTDEGVAIISTTQTSESAQGFSYENADPSERYVSVETFDRYAEDWANHDKGLPVHRFSKREFLDVLAVDFDVLYWWEVSYWKESFLPLEAAALQISPNELRDVASTQFAIVRTKELGSAG